MKKSLSLLMMTAFAVMSCSVEELQETLQYEQKEVTITATLPLDDAAKTKTVLVDGADVYWKPQDQIKVFSAGAGSKFTSLNTEPASTANFSGMISVVSGTNESIEDSYIWGLYPYRADATYSDGKITTTLPARQEGAEGTFADDLLITMGRSLNFSIPFYNVCSGLKFTLTQEGVKYVTLTATGGEMIAGTFSVGLDAEGKPKVSEVTDGSSSVTVAAPDGGTFKTGVWYYIVTLPVTFSKGVTFTFSTGTLKGTRTIASSFSLSRGMFSRSTGVDKNIAIDEVDDTGFDAFSSTDDLHTPLCIEVVETDYPNVGCTINFWGVPMVDSNEQHFYEDALEYSKDGKNWVVIRLADSRRYRAYTINLYKGDKIYLRCGDLRYDKLDPDVPETALINEPEAIGEHLNIYVTYGKVKVYGNVMSLADKENFAEKTEIGDPYMFYGLFADDDVEAYYQSYMRYEGNYTSPSDLPEHRTGTGISLSPDRKLLLPATELSEGCYMRMFAGCKELESAPDLPATNLANECYREMFAGCSNLVSAPKLPAETIADGCYFGMFSGSGLLSPPSLPSKSLAPRCYEYMLTSTPIYKAPELPATSLSDYCYCALFSGCTNLQETPELPASELCEGCYSSLFENCENIKAARPLPITKLAPECYSWMYAGTGISVAPELPATELADWCYGGMFSNCKKLTMPPALPATSLSVGCYSSMFSGCANLSHAPSLPATALTDYCYRLMFADCEKLIVPPALPALELARDCYYYMFTGSGIVNAPSLPATVLARRCYGYMFLNCRDLQGAPKLPAMTLEQNCYFGMFMNCVSLETAPELPATTLASSCYYSMFEGCTSLVNAPSKLPAETLTSSCYNKMFYGCSSLEKAPELLWKSARYRIIYMFQNCSSLKYVKCLGSSSVINNFGNYFWMAGVSPAGTFVKDADVNWTGRVPEGWTIVNQGITLETKKLELLSGRSSLLAYQLYPVEGVPETITWSSSDADVAAVSDSGMVKALSAGSATITVSYGDFSSSCEVTVKGLPEGAVDLGLSVLWAECNLGASSPEEYGDYYAWAETSTKEIFTLDTYKYYNAGTSLLTKYCSNSEDGTVDNKSVLDTEDDAARSVLGGNWRLPTRAEQTELRDNCAWTWCTDYNGTGRNGYLITSSIPGYTDRSIFLPAGGYIGDSGLRYVGSYGFYWSSSANLIKSRQAYDLYFDSQGPDYGNTYYNYGELIRPVTD